MYHNIFNKTKRLIIFTKHEMVSLLTEQNIKIQNKRIKLYWLTNFGHLFYFNNASDLVRSSNRGF